MKSFFKQDAVVVAKKLLGMKISFRNCTGMIVETEAYKTDPASHGHTITPRSEIMLKTYGQVYVYLIYGMYYCLNFTTNEGEVGAVLIRALEPLKGMEKMKKRRKTDNIHSLTSGPGKLSQALGITKKENGTLINEKIIISKYKNISPKNIQTTTRIGITKGKDLLCRFYIKDNPFVSIKESLYKRS